MKLQPWSFQVSYLYHEREDAVEHIKQGGTAIRIAPGYVVDSFFTFKKEIIYRY